MAFGNPSKSVRETVKMARGVLEKELKDEESGFWKFKTGKFKAAEQKARYQGHISVDDIQWLLKGAWKQKRYAVRVIKEALEKELKDNGSGFYTYKTPKAEKGGYKNQITVDDIAWDLGPPWWNPSKEKGDPGRMRQLNIALNEIKAVDESVVEEEDLQSLTNQAQSQSLLNAAGKRTLIIFIGSSFEKRTEARAKSIFSKSFRFRLKSESSSRRGSREKPRRR